MGFAGGAGVCNIDLIYSGLDRLPQKGEEIYAGGFSMQFGGGVPATMVHLARLGIPARILTFLGRDFFSDFARKTLEECPADVENLYQGTGMPVVLSSTLLCQDDRSFVSYTDGADLNSEILERVYEKLKGADVVEMQTGFLDVHRRLKKEGTIQVFDTGWNDSLSLKTYGNYLETADYYVPNRKEALKITGTSTLKDAAEVLGVYFSDVIIKLDQEGCLLKNREGTRIIGSMRDVKAVDATGAGDAFLAGFLYGLYHHYPVEHCVRFGNVTGGACVQAVGCLTNCVTEAELLREAEKLQVLSV